MPTLFLCMSVFLFAFTVALSVAYKVAEKKIAEQNRLKKLLNIRNPASEKTSIARKKPSKWRPNDRGRLMPNLASSLSLAGIKLNAEEFIILFLSCAFLPSGISLLLGSDWLVSAALFVIGSCAPVFFLQRKKAKRIALMEEQLIQALLILGNCLKTGLSFQQALEGIVRETPEPISREFGRVLKEMQLGLPLESALMNMADRLKSKDFMLIVSAILIQRKVGGNLSEIMQNISETIRERLKIKANLRVLTTTGRTSGKVVGLIPVFLILILMLINPSYIRMFFETKAGTIMLFAAAILELTGFLVANRVIKVKF